MRTMKDSGIEWIGEIPESLGTLFAFQCFAQIKNKNIGMKETNLLSLSYGKIKRKDIETTGGLLPENFEGYNIISCDDIVLRLTDLQNDQKSLRVGLSTETGIVTSAYLTLRNKSKSLPRYLYYYLHSFDISKGFYGMGAGVRQGLNWEELKHLQILFPSPAEQAHIVSHLDRQCTHIDNIIEKTKASIEEYKKLRQAVITQAVTKGVRGERAMKDTGFDWLLQIPDDWTMERGKNLFFETNNRSDSGEEELLTVSQYTGVTPRSQKNVNMFEAETLEGYKICEIGDIAANTMWLWAGAIGVSEYYGVISPSYNIYRQKKDAYNSKYLDYLLRIPPIVQLFASLSTGIRASRLRLYPEQFLNIYYPLPPLDEQAEIVAYLQEKIVEVDKLITKKEQFLTELESYKKSMIYEYVTGKKEVPQA